MSLDEASDDGADTVPGARRGHGVWLIVLAVLLLLHRARIV